MNEKKHRIIEKRRRVMKTWNHAINWCMFSRNESYGSRLRLRLRLRLSLEKRRCHIVYIKEERSRKAKAKIFF